ncbi:MAG: flavin reductase family protein [Chloroflexi bacterium]|nr:flavin reductase family protein [Chloroflexota bacterium]
MAKIAMGPRSLISALPAFLVGANVDGRPNFLAVGASGIANATPPMVSVAIHPDRYSHRGIVENGTFSVNVPSVDLVRETDYCGVVSGARFDKAAVCGFDVFYGKLGSAPLIEQCPVNLECSVVHALELGSHTLFVGRIEEVHVTESCLTDGKPDVSKIRPIAYVRDPVRQYQALGEVIARAHSVGLELRDRE